jgi:hypothetical protein
MKPTAMKRNFTTLISELPARERKAMEKRIKTATLVLRQCESRLQRYKTGDDNALKTSADMRFLQVVLENVRTDLIRSHKLPSETIQ